jgi:hypothetical protein
MMNTANIHQVYANKVLPLKGLLCRLKLHKNIGGMSVGERTYRLDMLCSGCVVGFLFVTNITAQQYLLHCEKLTFIFSFPLGARLF